MTFDPAVHCFADDFERFHTLLLKQVETCPEELWAGKSGGHFFWQELAHAFYCVQLYALPEGEEERLFGLTPKAAMLREDALTPMTKGEVRQIADTMEAMAYAFMGRLTRADLLLPHAALCRFTGKERTNLHALIGLIRHYNYHLGCCDAALRANGISGVY